MSRISKLGLRVGAASIVAWAAGCVPISDYKKLEKRFAEQEAYVVSHRKEMRERERREQVLTLRAREQERQVELLRARLQKSELLRQRLADRLKQAPTVEASAPRPEPIAVATPQPQQVMGLEVNQETGGLVLENGVLFAPGEATLKPAGKKLLDALIKELTTSRYATKRVRIDGHTDSTPIKRTKSKNESNWDLSGKRALEVLHYLEKHGIKSDRLSFSGYASFKPMTSGSGKKDLARNRRVEIVILD
ncbi:MAG: flagellar motor protein MotB [Planctomycetota bacterium]